MDKLNLFIVLSITLATAFVFQSTMIPVNGLSHDNKTKTGLDYPAMPMGDRSKGVNNSLLTTNLTGMP
jgi:hypothetical protein